MTEERSAHEHTYTIHTATHVEVRITEGNNALHLSMHGGHGREHVVITGEHGERIELVIPMQEREAAE